MWRRTSSVRPALRAARTTAASPWTIDGRRGRGGGRVRARGARPPSCARRRARARHAWTSARGARSGEAREAEREQGGGGRASIAPATRRAASPIARAAAGRGDLAPRQLTPVPPSPPPPRGRRAPLQARSVWRSAGARRVLRAARRRRRRGRRTRRAAARGREPTGRGRCRRRCSSCASPRGATPAAERE